MRILINALAVTNASGRHVVLGHLSRLVPRTADRHEYVILYHPGNRDICRDLGSNARWVECPALTSGWAGRALWERVQLPKLVRKAGVQAVLSTSGSITLGLDVAQASLAMNPWALVRGLRLTPLEQFKTMLQRHAYRATSRSATAMAFLSGFMREAYRENAGRDARASHITYCGLEDETFTAAARLREGRTRRPLQILSVSLMARHKGVETLVSALEMLRRQYRIPATLRLVGGWPDRAYRTEIETQVARLGLDESVTFAGHVTRDELHAAYAESQVYCLMSWCESFGIPAAEAQAFGTPVVSSNCCAIPEVCGEGGLYPAPGRVDEVAAALATVLTDAAAWQRLSEGALRNVQRFRWDVCSVPFVELIDDLAAG